MSCRCVSRDGYRVCESTQAQDTVLLLALIASVRIVARLARLCAALGLGTVALYALVVEIPPLHPLLTHGLRSAVLALPRGNTRDTLIRTFTPAALRWTPPFADAAAVATTCVVVSLLLLRGHRLILVSRRAEGLTALARTHRIAVVARLALALWLAGTTAVVALRATSALAIVLSDHRYGQRGGALVQAQAFMGLHGQDTVAWTLAALVLSAALCRVVGDVQHGAASRRTRRRRSLSADHLIDSRRTRTRYTA